MFYLTYNDNLVHISNVQLNNGNYPAVTSTDMKMFMQIKIMECLGQFDCNLMVVAYIQIYASLPYMPNYTSGGLNMTAVMGIIVKQFYFTGCYGRLK